MPAGYTRLAREADDRELDDAFESDHEDNEVTPLTTQGRQEHSRSASVAVPGAYDFETERDWMQPPPGSPTRPSALAQPNEHGNSNGMIPSAPVVPPARSTRPSFFRRAVGAIMPSSNYARLPQSDVEAAAATSTRRGGGIENDGVFANVMAKPQVAQTIRTENGEVHMVPESSQKEVPPSYVEAQADAAPSYFETTVHAPSTPDANGEMIVEDLPTGSFLSFIMTMAVSFFFQFVGFLLTYLLHTSHAGKYGARAGLGITLIQYGFYWRNAPSNTSNGSGEDFYGNLWPPQPSSTSTSERRDGASEALEMDDSYVVGGFTMKDWFSFFLMTVGWFMFISSLIGFARIKRWEKHIRDSTATPQRPHSAEDLERDREIRRNLENVFGLGMFREEATPEVRQNVRDDGNGNVIVLPNREMLEEARLARDLRAAGLL